MRKAECRGTCKRSNVPKTKKQKTNTGRKKDRVLPGTTFLIFIPCIGTPLGSAKAPRIWKGSRKKNSELCRTFMMFIQRIRECITSQADASEIYGYLLHCGSLGNTNDGYCIGSFVLHQCTSIILILSRERFNRIRG